MIHSCRLELDIAVAAVFSVSGYPTSWVPKLWLDKKALHLLLLVGPAFGGRSNPVARD
jgi:hypothetical protein